ncbi:MAG: Type 1 glutamine amidotransferase-like domain-containing protein [Chloroflexi bacterium]|nr:Type 1 glutamine amidotransferase-like domain-containing protein [Chloroflexota bacterium]
MNGLIALLGSGEYLSVMDEVDKFLLANCNADGRVPRVVCLPTASGREGERSWGRWMRMGEEHFTRLGADVKSLPVIDRVSADDDTHASAIESADLIYFSGGDPNYLYQTMNGSRAWDAAQKAFGRGASYAGCSAGAMILAKSMPDFRRAGFGTREAFGLAPATFILPHFDSIPAIWRPFITALTKRLKKGESLLGIDEETALIGKLGGEWRVHGHKTVSRYTREGKQVFRVGEEVGLT